MKEHGEYRILLLCAGSILLAGSTWCCFAETRPVRGLSQSGAPLASAADAVKDSTPVSHEHWGYNPAPEAHLEVKEVQRGPSPKGTKITYHFASSGFPEGKSYTLWLMESGDQRTFPLMAGYAADATGRLVCPEQAQAGAPVPGKSHCIPFENIQMEVDGFHNGEPLDYAIVSTDGMVRAYAQTYPFPILAQDGKCTLHVQLDNKRFNMFTILGEGFEPNEQVATSSNFGNGASEKSSAASPQGKFAVISLINVPGKNSGTATFSATGSSCKIAVSYDWGKAASKVQ